MVVLNASYWIFTVIGVIVTALTVALSMFIMYRFAFSFTLLYSDIVPFDVTFMMGLVGSNFLEMRSFLAAFIAIERVMATMMPLKFYHYRRYLSNIPIFGFILSTGAAVNVVLFGFCDFRLPLQPGCVNYACAVPPCFFSYSQITKLFYGSLNASFSALLCCKLFLLSWRQATVPTDIRKANLISLTDGLSTLVFELLPTMIFDSRIIDIRAYGPVVGVLRQSGRFVEALVMVKLMDRKKVIQPARVSVSARNIA
ncbi:unnamed protein product [Caenorhabditis brenneri]